MDCRVSKTLIKHSPLEACISSKYQLDTLSRRPLILSLHFSPFLSIFIVFIYNSGSHHQDKKTSCVVSLFGLVFDNIHNMSSSSLGFLMVEQEEECKRAKLEILESSRMSIKIKNKLKRRRCNSRAVHQLKQTSKRSTSSSGVLGRRVKTLKGLVPNSHKCVSVDGLFKETADYILALQLKVRVMQTMIDLVSDSGSD